MAAMEALKEQYLQLLDNKENEPNSGFDLVRIFVIHFAGVTAFCHVAEAKLNNNRVNQ